MKFFIKSIAPFILVALMASPVSAATKLDAALKQLGAETIRGIDSDVALPRDADEYLALGKNAILMVTASSAISTELPLWSVYAQQNGVRVPLNRVLVLDKHMDENNSRAIQVSFYLLPVQFMKRDTVLYADFNGGRKAFGFISYSKKSGLPKSAPAFARLDEYDNPGDASADAISGLIAREFAGSLK